MNVMDLSLLRVARSSFFCFLEEYHHIFLKDSGISFLMIQFQSCSSKWIIFEQTAYIKYATESG